MKLSPPEYRYIDMRPNKKLSVKLKLAVLHEKTTEKFINLP